jgi:hypothetical protein
MSPRRSEVTSLHVSDPMLPSNKNGGSGTMEALKTKSKGIQAVRIDFFLFILKVTNIRCFILIKCSEQEARFKKYAIMS